MMGPDLRINPDLTAIEFEDVLAVFAGDRTLTWKGEHAALVFQTLKALRDDPEGGRDLLRQERFRRLIPALLEQGVLVRVRPIRPIRSQGAGAVADALSALSTADQAGAGDSPALVVCLPDDYSLTGQTAAIRSLSDGDALVTGFRRGSTYFVLPLITARDHDIEGVVARLLGSEPGIGNLFLGHQLLHARQAFDSTPVPAAVARWIAHDLWSLIAADRLDTETARVYRGEALVREDVRLKIDGVAPLPEEPERIVEAIGKAVCGHARPVTARVENPPMDAAPGLCSSFAIIGRPSFSVLTTEEQLSVSGAGPTRALAALAATMEGLERYSAGCFSPRAYPFCTAAELPGPVLEPDAVSGFGAGDTPRYPPHRASDVRRWQAVTCLRTGRTWFVPVELIYYPLAAETLGYLPCDETNSSGTAAHFRAATATLHALAEILEREAFLIAWLRKASPPRVARDSLTGPTAARVESLGRAGVDTWLLNLTTDSCPIIAALMRRRVGDGSRYGIGASAHPDATTACRKAVDEATLGVLSRGKAPRSAAEVEEHLRTPADHLELYASGVFDDLLLPLFEAGAEVSIVEIASFRGDLVSCLLDRGHEIYGADVTAPLVREGLPDCHVIRVLMPGIIPMRFGRLWARTGGERLWRIPESSGWQPRARSHDELQRFPHPFA